MLRTILVTLSLLFALVAVIGSIGSGEELTNEPEDESWRRYVASYKDGRSWTHEHHGGFKSTTEVTDVTDIGATIWLTMFDADGEVMSDRMQSRVSFKFPVGSGFEGAESAPEFPTKYVTVKAGTFLCVGNWYEGKYWFMKKYRAILVWSEHMELIEFNE